MPRRVQCVLSFSVLDALSNGGFLAEVWEISSQRDAPHHRKVLLLSQSWLVGIFVLPI